MDIKQLGSLIGKPNYFTLFRIIVVPVLIILLLFPNRLFSFFAAVVFSLAAITDFFDGFFARKRNIVTNFGKIMDPIADKILISSVIIMLVSNGRFPAWIACIIIIREISVTGLRNFIALSKGDIGASKLGKWKTGFQIGSIIPLLIHYTYFGINLHFLGMIALWIALILTVWSGIDYFIRFRNVLDN